MRSDKITAIIVDDEKESIDLLTDLLKPHSEIQILATIQNSSQAAELILMNRPEVLLLDIQMPEKNGFKVLEDVNNNGFYPKVIFVTAYDQFAIQAIKHAALDYLLKPVIPDELNDAIAKLKSKPANQLQKSIEQLLHKIDSNRKLKFNTRAGFIIINSADIVYCKADRNYTEVYLNDGRMEVLTHPLKYIDQILTADNFFRGSRSLLINLDYLVKAERTKKRITLQFDDQQAILSLPGSQIKAIERLKD